MATSQVGVWRRARIKSRLADNITGWVFVLPVVLATLIFEVLPVFPNLYFGLHTWDGLTPMQWNGLGNYDTLINSSDFWESVEATLLYTVAVVPLTMVAGFSLALLVHQQIPGNLLFRAIFYLPVISSVVATVMIWRFLLAPTSGLINLTLLNLFKIDGPSYLFEIPWAMIVVVLFGVWTGMGYQMVVFLAGLKGIPSHLYEAAKIDGANAVQRVRFVTIPMLTPVFFLLFIVSTIAAVNVFTTIVLLTTAGYGGASAVNGTRVLVIFLYEEGLNHFRYGLASSVAVIVMALVGILTLINWKVGQRFVHYSD